MLLTSLILDIENRITLRVFRLLIFGVFILVSGSLHARHFEISADRVLATQPRNESGKFEPCLEVQLQVGADMPVGKSFARAYFYDSAGKLIRGSVGPIHARHDGERVASALPFYFYRDNPVKVRFPFPGGLERYPYWRAVVVFGDERP